MQFSRAGLVILQTILVTENLLSGKFPGESNGCVFLYWFTPKIQAQAQPLRVGAQRAIYRLDKAIKARRDGVR